MSNYSNLFPPPTRARSAAVTGVSNSISDKYTFTVPSHTLQLHGWIPSSDRKIEVDSFYKFYRELFAYYEESATNGVAIYKFIVTETETETGKPLKVQIELESRDNTYAITFTRLEGDKRDFIIFCKELEVLLLKGRSYNPEFNSALLQSSSGPLQGGRRTRKRSNRKTKSRRSRK